MDDYHYWQWSLSHKQVYGSDAESNETLKGNARRAFLLLRRGYAHRETSHDTMCTSSRIVKCK